jgi:elongator complex protein 3
MIRELHVYGRTKQVGSNVNGGAQHFGIGRKLLSIAESVSINNGFNEIAVISGIGVRDYYRKRGYQLNGTYMTKELCKGGDDFVFILCLFIIYAIISYYNNLTMIK